MKNLNIDIYTQERVDNFGLSLFHNNMKLLNALLVPVMQNCMKLMLVEIKKSLLNFLDHSLHANS